MYSVNTNKITSMFFGNPKRSQKKTSPDATKDTITYYKSQEAKVAITVFLSSEMELQTQAKWPLFQIIESIPSSEIAKKQFKKDILVKYGLRFEKKRKTIFEQVEEEEKEDGAENINPISKHQIVEMLTEPLICHFCGTNFEWGRSVAKLECRGHYYASSSLQKCYRCCRAPYREPGQSDSGRRYCTMRDHSVYPTNARDAEKVPLWLVLSMCAHYNRSPRNIVMQATTCHLELYTMEENNNNNCDPKDRFKSFGVWKDKYKVCLLTSYIMLPYIAL